MNKKYSNEHIDFIHELRCKKIGWSDLAVEFTNKFKIRATETSVRLLYLRNSKDNLFVEKINDNRRISKVVLDRGRENRMLSDYYNKNNDIIDSLKKCLLNKPITIKYKKIKKSDNVNKKDMIIELFLSDWHVGAETEEYTINTTKKRIEKIRDKFISEIKEKSNNFNIKEIKILIGGDMIQSSVMHAGSCWAVKLTDVEQIAKCTEFLVELVILPLSKLDIPIEILGVAGNHDRLQKNKFVGPEWKTYSTYIIYSNIELILKHLEISHVKMIMSKAAYQIYKVFDSFYSLEHGTQVGNTDTSFNQFLFRRSQQEGVLLSGLRLAHFHVPKEIDNGKFIINGSITGGDGYYEKTMGFSSTSGQMIVFYVKNKKNPFSYCKYIGVN
jgi:hypothetical protein